MFTATEKDRIREAVFSVTGTRFEGEVEVCPDKGLRVELRDGRATLHAGDRNALARGYFLLCRAVREGVDTLDVRQERRFISCGAMLDCSRGGVMTVEAVCRYIDRLAALGMNLLMLYTEDTYAVPRYPYMGYLRGRYSAEELRRMDDYADSMGVELVPCIQTLGHMGQFLQWKENAQMKDLPNVLMADEEEVYRFIEAEIAAVRASMRSRRIHIGMDEAHGVGLGRYYEKHGPVNRFELLNRHLTRVVELCGKYDFHPMMWSDMFFRLGSKTNEYYDLGAVFGSEVTEQIPDVDLVYWDYYHSDEAFYDQMLTRHEQMGKTTVFAGGVWTWSGFLPHVQWTDATMRPALRQCAKHQVGTVIATLWGDDGAETELSLADSQLPLFSEACWQGEDCPDAELAKTGECLTGLPRRVYDAFGDFYPGAQDRRTGKGLIWCDILYPLMEYDGDSMDAVIARSHRALETLADFEDRLDCRYAASLFRVCVTKAALVRDLRARYLVGDRAYLQSVVEEEIPRLLVLYDALTRAHRALWEHNRKRFGWEVISLRYGAVCGRLNDARDELARYLACELPTVAELDEEPLPSERKGGMQFFQVYVTPSYTL